MSDTEERKSMDDVLASIRRIVRAEKDPEAAQEVTETVGEATVDATVAPAESAPLALTPDMRVADEAAEDMVGEMPPVAETLESLEPDVAPAASMAMDPEMLRAMVREVVMEELAGADGDQLIRKVIREELVTGDIGANISKNVMRLIRTEVDSAMGKKS